MLARRVAKINGDEAMFAGLVHDLGVFYLMSRAANFPELIEDKAGLHDLLVQWHDNIGHALLAAMGLSEALLVAVQEHEVERPVPAVKTLADVLFVANKLANTVSGWRDPEFCDAVDTSALAAIFDGDTIAALLTESEDEVQSLKAALTG